MNKIDRIKELIQTLNKASYAYYQEDNPFLTDKQFDNLYDELEFLEKETGIVMANSPTQKVQGFLLDGLKKVKHTVPMLSAAKTKDMNEIKKFIGNRSVLCSFKLDGLTLVTRYSNGKFVQAITRGSGYEGEDVTEQAKMIINLPMQIPFDGDLELRGECVISWDNFRKINESLEVPYSHPRNLASGSIRQLDTNIVKQRNLEYVVFDLVTGKEFEYKNQALNWIDSLGFTTVDRIVLPSSGCDFSPCFENSLTTNSLDYVDKYLSTDKSKYPIDGQIYEYDNIQYGKSLGSTAHHDNKLIARKFKDITYETILKNVEWNTTRTGTISAVAIFDPVDLDGAITSRATLHNLSFIKDLELGIGDTIVVYRSNMVIPAIDENLTRSNTLEIPSVCHCCGYPTEIRKNGKANFLYCTNENCQSRLLAKLVHFVDKDSMNIDGLSEATLQTFINKRWLKDVSDIYKLHLHETEMQHMKGFGKRSVTKLLDAIDKSRTVTMANFIRSLGIPLIGRTQSKALHDFCNGDINKFDEYVSSRVDFSTKIEGFGEKRNQSIHDWFRNSDNVLIYNKLRKEVTFVRTEGSNKVEEETNHGYTNLSDMTFVITGSLNHFNNRDELKSLLESLGAKVSGSVSKKTTALICNDSESGSSKSKKAAELGVLVWTEEQLLKEIEV